MIRSWLYALACVLVPAVWGGLMYLVFGWWRARRGTLPPRREKPPVDYII